jgi:hypothetical protein
VRRLGSRGELAVDVAWSRRRTATCAPRSTAAGSALEPVLPARGGTLAIRRCASARDDIPLLVEHFLRDAGWDAAGRGAESRRRRWTRWPRLHFAGNVRELRNLSRRGWRWARRRLSGGPEGSRCGESRARSNLRCVQGGGAQLLDEFEAGHYRPRRLLRARRRNVPSGGGVLGRLTAHRT